MSSFLTGMPSGGVCGVIRFLERISSAFSLHVAASRTSCTPPPLPLPPACTCAFTTASVQPFAAS